HAWLLVHGPRSRELADVARKNGAHAAPIDTTGLGGAAMVTPLASYGAALAALRAEGGVEGSCEAWEELRLERGVPKWGKDYGDDTYPQEASLEKVAVSFNKGCYLGQETVCMLELRGHVKRKLMKLVIDAAPLAIEEGADIALPDGTVVGNVTTRGAGNGPEQTLALGYVKYKHAAPGTELRIAGHTARIASE